MPDPTRFHWAALTTAELPALVARDPVVVLPVAAVEQHGPHLPLSTDLEIAGGILDAALASLPERFPVRILPAQAVGASPEHASFPGTLTLQAGLLEQVLVELGASVAAAGVRRLLVFNAHGGNRATLEGAGLRLRREHRLLVVKATYTRFPPPPEVELPEVEWRHGLHGGAVETAMMLHLRPGSVRRDALAPRSSLGEGMEGILGPEGIASFAWLAEDLHPSGAVGDPSLATPSMGARLVSHYGSVLARVIREARGFPLERIP